MNSAGTSSCSGLTWVEGRCHIPVMASIRKVCVYCGSRPGTDPAFVAAATRLGELFVEHRVGLVYGGGSKGLMGALARSVHQLGGEVVGIIPEFLKTKEQLFADADEVIVTHDMHERKRLMFDRADAFVALPGGIGTLEELVEQTDLGATRASPQTPS